MSSSNPAEAHGKPDSRPADAYDLSAFQLDVQRLNAEFDKPADGKVAVLDLEAVDGAQEPDIVDRQTKPADRLPRPAGPGLGAMAIALGWIGGVAGLASLQYGGLEDIILQPPLTLAMLAGAAIGPAVLMLTTASAAREAHRARQDQHRTGRFLRRMMLGSEDMTGQAQTFGRSIRTELEEIQASMTSALDRMAELEAAAIRNAHAFEDAITGASSGASVLSDALNAERTAFSALNADLQNQTEHLGATVGRQIRLMREASNLVRQETARADQTLTANIATLATSTAALGEKSEALEAVVQTAAAGSVRFNETLGQALDTMGEATRLNDAARQSAETSAIAAQTAAQAVRDASVRAAADARRVTEIIRAETKAMQDQAQAAMEQLRAAAEEARRAAEESEAAAERYTAPQRRPVANQNPNPVPTASRGGGRNLAQAIAQPANDIDPGEEIRRRALRLVQDCGIELDQVFGSADLDYIAARSKDGPTARRRAVSLAAMDSVERIALRLGADARAREAAMAYRARPELATGDLGRNALKAYLLLDAALG